MTPRGIEILVKKASVDGEFKRHLLKERSGAAQRIGLALDPAEAAMLDSIPEAQLVAIIEKTKVAPLLRPAFMGYAAAAMLAAVGGVVVLPVESIGREEAEFEEGTEYSEDGATYITVGVRPDELKATPKEEKFHSVSGQVTDIKGNPLEDVVVEVLGSTDVGLSDAKGYFRFENIREGSYTVRFIKTGYRSIDVDNVEVDPYIGAWIEVELVSQVEGENE